MQYLTWGRIEASSNDYSFLRTCNNFEASFGFAFLKKSKLLKYTVFENHRKSLIQNCERSELRLHFEWTKVH